jgi:protease I
MKLEGKRIAVLVGQGYEELEFWYPVMRCREEGGEVVVAGIEGADVVSGRREYPVIPDCAVSDYSEIPSLIVIPGIPGYSFDRLPAEVTALLRASYEAGAWMVGLSSGVGALASASLLDGATVSCDPSVAKLVEGSGAKLSDAPVTVEAPLATTSSVGHIAELFGMLLQRLAA